MASSVFETAVRPWASPGVAPVPFSQPGSVGVPEVRLAIGLKSKPPKTFNFSINGTITFKVTNRNVETPPANGW
jgi:hypothetical protein